ncbi:MAG: DNA repair protein RecO [Clostridia bacterium]|nr:DNA repair protein RecO [Clostridia bacterium]
MFIKTEALVLRETEYKDHDKLLTLLTKEHGKLTVRARGVKGKTSKIKAGCQLLCYSEFTLRDYQGFYYVSEAESIQMFPELRDNLELLSLASYFAQAAEVISQEDVPNPELLSLLLNAIYALSKLKLPQKLVKAGFELRIACLSGYEPYLDRCPVCGKESPDRFNVTKGVVHCASCHDGDLSEGLRLPVSEGTLAAMRYIVFAPAKKLFSFTLSDDGLHELSGLTETFLVTQLERGFYTLDFYKSLTMENTYV